MRSSSILIVSLIVLTLGIPHSALSAVTEFSLKAAFLYNFAKFTEWPNQANNLVVCLTDDSPLGDALDQLKSKPIQGRAIVVRRSVNDFRSCQIVFVERANASRVTSILSGLASSPVLTVSDMDGFVESGGMVGLVTDDNRVKFHINLRAAKRAGVTISSQLVRLATAVAGK